MQGVEKLTTTVQQMEEGFQTLIPELQSMKQEIMMLKQQMAGIEKDLSADPGMGPAQAQLAQSAQMMPEQQPPLA